GEAVTAADVEKVARWNAKAQPSEEIAFTPSRVLMQDFTGVPAIVDLAAMREAMATMGGDPAKINPLQPAELVIDHSIQVDEFLSRTSFAHNAELEFQRNRERYAFLRWGQTAFDNFAVVPPNTGICHQVNLEYLGRVVYERDGVAFPDTLVGTDSHTTMINGLGVLGWGVGGIEAEAGAASAAGPATRRLADRATIGHMSPEYGATCGIVPVDKETLRYLEFTGRPRELVALVEAYTKEQGLFHDESSEEATYSDT